MKQFKIVLHIGFVIVGFIYCNDERMHHYQRGRTSITGLMVELRNVIETERLVVVVMTRLVLHLIGEID